jgi:hypothetical protein
MVIAKGKGSTSACVLTVLKKVPWVNPLFSSIKTIYKNLGNTVCCFLLLLIFAPYETWFFYVYFFLSEPPFLPGYPPGYNQRTAEQTSAEHLNQWLTIKPTKPEATTKDT